MVKVDNSGRPKGAASTADSGAGTAFAKQYADNQIAQGLKDLAATETRSRGNDQYKNAHDFSGDTSLGESIPKSVVKAKPVVKAKAAPVARVPVETTASKAARQEAYVDWKKSQEKLNDLVKRKGYAKGGSVKSSVSSRGDGCATKGKTKGRIV